MQMVNTIMESSFSGVSTKFGGPTFLGGQIFLVVNT